MALTYEKQLQTEDGTIAYREADTYVVITGGETNAGILAIPDCIADKPVVEITKKAFLGSRLLREVVIPKSVERIGDWAFSHCRNLETVYVPAKEIVFGQGVFDHCMRMQRIYPYQELLRQESKLTCVSEREELDKLARLLAGAITLLKAEYMLEPENAGSDEWYEKWDAKLLSLLHTRDEDGYQFMVLCGEEDLSANYDDYVYDRQKYKARMCYLRLVCHRLLTQEIQAELEQYIMGHTVRCESQAAWDALLDFYGDERAFYELFVSLGCIDDHNLSEILLSMGDRHPEMKAYLMEQAKGADSSYVEDTFKLDW